MVLKKNENKSKKGGGFAAILFGIAILIALTVVLFNNEGRSVKRAKALKNIADAVEISSTAMDASNDKALVLFSDVFGTDEALSDEEFGVSAPKGSIKLSRNVEMYQWKESSETDDDDVTTYDYDLVWSSSLIDSSNFEYQAGHQNPRVFPFESKDYVATKVNVGEYEINQDFVKKLNNFDPMMEIEVMAEDLFITSVQENSIFISAEGYSDLSYPEVGDVLIEYEIVSPEMITVVGMKDGSMLVPFSTKTGDLAEVSYGEKNKEAVMEEKLTENKILTWAIRGASLIGMMVGVGLVFSPLTNLLQRIPLVGNLINRGIGLVAALLGGGWGLLVIAFGWLFFKPVLSFGLIVLVVGLIVFVSLRSKDKKEAEATA